MWAVDAPTRTALESAQACASGVRDKGLRTRLNAALSDFRANSATLQTNIHSQQLHLTRSKTYSVTGLTDTELKWLYNAQLSKQGSKARYVYDHIKGNALHELCSYCQYGIADTLDHFIPITVVHQLAVDPWNLVPACNRCNKLLQNKFITVPEQQMIHPYAVPASVPPSARWLRAIVHAGDAPVMTFHADPDSSVDDVTRGRIINQFELLELGKLYRIVSARELSGTCHRLSERFSGAQSKSVAAHLRELSEEAFATDTNERRGAMYEALAADAWFTTTGYRMAS